MTWFFCQIRYVEFLGVVDCTVQCCKTWVCQDRAVGTQPTLIQCCTTLLPPTHPWEGIYKPQRTSLCPCALVLGHFSTISDKVTLTEV